MVFGSRGSIHYAVATAVLALGASMCSCRSTSHPREELTKAQQNTYVDPAVCSGCHAGIVKSYRLTGMGRSFYRPRADTMVEDFKTRNTFYHRASDRYYEMLQRDGKYYQRRYQKDIDGSMTNVIEKQIDYVLGSGNHARSYLNQTGNGRLVELPVSWYTENGGYWAMSPGYDRPDHQDFRRVILQDCMGCHNAYPQNDVPASKLGGDAIFGGTLPEGIDCQRCHGPGQAHVHAASNNGAIFESRLLTPDISAEIGKWKFAYSAILKRPVVRCRT